MALSQDQRKQLDGIVAKMDADGAGEAEIKAVVQDFTTKFAAAPPEASPLERFGQGLKHLTIDPAMDAASGVAHYVQDHPMEAGATLLGPAGMAAPVIRGGMALLKGAKAGIESEAAKAGALMDQTGAAARGPTGRGLSATGHMIAAAVPVVGPVVAGSVERAASGDMAGAAGELTGLLGTAEAGRAVEGAAATTTANRAVASEVGGQGMDATRIAAAAKNAEEIAKAQEAADAVRGMSGLGKQPTNIEQANSVIGVRPKDLKKGYQPAEGVLRNDIPVNGRTRAEVAGDITTKLGEFGDKKQGLLGADRIAGSAEDVSAAADLLKPEIVNLKKIGDTAGARQFRAAYKEIKSLVTPETKTSAILGPDGNPVTETTPAAFGPDLTPKDFESIIERVDGLIKATGSGALKADLRNNLYKIRRMISDAQVAGDPALRDVNTQMRDLLSAKRAITDRILREKASAGPKTPAEAAPPEPMAPAAPAPDSPVPAQTFDPSKLQELLASQLPLPLRLAYKGYRAITKTK